MKITGLTIVVLTAFCVCTTHATREVSKLEPQEGGKGGGFRVTIFGAGFSADQFNFGEGNEKKGNEVKLVKTDDTKVTYDGEIHKDGSTESQIMFYSPSGMIDGSYMVKVKVDGETVTDCTASKCLYTVKDQYTPYIDSIVPQSGKAGDVILTIHGRIFTTRVGSNTLDSSNGISQKLLRTYAPQTCNLFEAQDVFYKLELDSPDSYYGTLQCKPEGTFVGNANPSILIEPPYGRSLFDASLDRVSSDGSIYTVQYYTDVQSISPQTGSNLGNLKVTVTGDYYETAGNKSTYKPAEVFIGGQNCSIVHVEKNKEIVCIVPPKTDNPYSFYPGNRGVLLESWSEDFVSYDAAFSKTDAPESVDWIDETLYCGNLTKKLTRMTGVLTVPFNGNYQFLIKADEGGKFIIDVDDTQVGIESTGDWGATGLIPLMKGQLIKTVMVGKPGTNAESCIEMRLHHLDTTVTETEKSKSEIQTIRLTSEIKYQNYTLKFSDFASSTPTNEKQTLCLTGSSSKYQLKLYNVSTGVVDVSVASNAKDALDKLPFLTPEESFSVEKNVDNDACIDITFSSKRGDIPLIETVPDTGVTVTEVVQGSSNNLDFAFIFNGVPSLLITYDTSNKTAFANTIEDALYGMFSVQCPNILTTGGHYQISFEPDTHTLGSQVTSEVVPFCGRNSCKNCYRLFPLTEANAATSIALLYQWLCFGARGHEQNWIFLKYEDKYGNQKKRWLTIEDSGILGDGDWTYKCVNIKEEFNNAWPNDVSTAFQLIEARLPYNEGDFYVDEIFIGKTKPTGTMTSIKGMRQGPASPNTNLYEAIEWVTVAYDETDDKYIASIAPFGCLHDFDLLTLAGSTVSGDYMSSSSSVTSSLKTSASPAGTLVTTVTSKASKPLQGTVTLNYDGSSSTAIDVEKEDKEFEEALINIDGIGTVDVQRTSTSTCANMDINVEFTSVPGDRPLMTITSDFTSGNGGTAEVVPKRDGYLEISPIPGDMLSTIHDNPQVQVKINGVPTKCAMADHECSFTYSTDSTPTITNTDISEGNQNDVLTITGTMFSATPSENMVTIGGVPCDVTSSTITQIVCTVGNGPLGQYPVEVTVEGKGMASGNIQFSYTANLDSISPQTSTLGGNVVLTVSGEGLSDDTVVLFEAEECVKTASEIPTKIYCTVPAYTDLTVTSDQTVTVTVKSGDVVISTQSFVYNYIVAQITSVTPSGVLTVHGGQNIVIQGTNLGELGKVYLGENELIVNSRSETEIQAVTPEPTLPGMGLKLLVFYGTDGAILQGSTIPTLDVELSVSLVYPSEVSLYGGAPLTIIGTGFGDLKTHVKVTVGENDCEITDVTNNKINCILASTATVHKVNNLGTTGYGPFNPSKLTVQQGDFVEWTWTSSEFHELLVSIAETETPSSLENKAGGISSRQTSSEGSFMERMVKEGPTYFWTGYMDSDKSYYRMIVEVKPREATKEAVTVIVNDFEADYNLNSGQTDPQDDSGCAIASSDIENCTLEEVAESDDTKFNIFFTKCRSPAVNSISFPEAVSTVDRSALPTTELAISGTGFSTADCANEGKIGDCPCTVTESTVESFKCTLASDCQPEVGKYLEFSLMVNQYGNALVNIQNRLDRSAVFVSTIQSLLPTSGSSQGETVVTVTGTGFTSDLDKLVVNFGDYAAVCSGATQTSLVCTTPYNSAPGSVTVTVKSDGVQALCESDCSFKYDTTITPQVISVSPTQISNTATLTIVGEKFGSDPTKLSIMVGGEICGGITVETDDVTVSCSIEAVPAGENQIELLVDGVGKALCADGVSVTGEATATVNPASGSVHGGTVLNFSGHGYVEGLSIQVDGTDICEEITVKSLKEVECITVAYDPMAVDLDITSNGVTYESVNFEFSEDASPNVISVVPDTGAVGDTVTIECERCGAVASDIEVSIGGAECTGVTLSGTVITCATGSQSSGAHDVIVDVSGKGRSQPGVSFTYQVTVSSIDPQTVDEKGNQLLTVNGNGLSEAVSVTVCDKECTFSSLPSSSEYKCITPPGTGSCDVKVTEGDVTVTATQQLTYQANMAPFIETITPSRGGTGGNTQITISGSRFSDTMSDVTVTIDGVPCVVSSSSTTEIVCNTGAHSGSKLSEVAVVVSGLRGTATDLKVLTFYYVDAWSSAFTWGGEAPPGEGEFVVIPKDQIVLLDTDTEVLEMIVIMGEVIFDEVNLTFRAKRILITSGGNLQIGSEERRFPAHLKAVIELYGNHRDEELPIYGTKFIAVRNGTLNIFGAEIENTWTRLAATANVGATAITVQDTISDWKVGDEIFIATTGSKDSTNENEKRTIAGITDKTITFDEPLGYKHLGETEQYSGPFEETVDFEYRAEVGLLTRNVVMRGSSLPDWTRDIVACEKGFDSGEFVTQTCFEGRFGEEKGSSQFGGQIIFHASEKDTQVVVGHISYLEVTFAGQAFRLGRYPIHFHLNGDMSQSYVKGCAIHETFNRAINVHGSHNILIESNVVYNVMGGALFLEDGIETGNTFQYNLVCFVRASSSLLNDDITPASYWVTNPNNTYIHNTAVGGTHFGFWYRMHDHPDGPSFTESVCPQRVPILKFQFNTAHSFGWFGLWIFQEYYPGLDGSCNPTSAAPAYIENFTAWNNEKGAEFVNYGSVIITGARFVQNVLAGFEGKRSLNAPVDNSSLSPTVNDTLIVGQANNTVNQNSKGVTKAGFIWPYGDPMEAHNIKFINFDAVDAVAMMYTKIDGTCSELCGGYTNRLSSMKYENVQYRIKYRWMHEGVIKDMDGSLSGTNTPTKLLPTDGNPPAGCTISSSYVSPDGLDAAECPFDMNFHRFAFNNLYPSSLAGKTFIATDSNDRNSSSEYRSHRVSHPDGHTVVLVGGLVYTFIFEGAEDITNVSFTGRFGNFDEGDCLVFKLKLVQMPDIVSLDGGNHKPSALESPISCATSNLTTGDWYYADGYLSASIVGKSSGTDPSEHNVQFTALRCLFPNCEMPSDPETTLPPEGRADPFQLWQESVWEHDSEVNQWKASKYDMSGQGPPSEEGVDVLIETGLWVLVNSENYSHLKLGTLIIKGTLEFAYEEELAYTLEADFIIILGGFLYAGWKDNPMIGTMSIVLTGNANTPPYTELDGYDIGSKALGVFGGLELHGRNISSTWTRLQTTVSAGEKVLTVDDGTKISEWRAGDKIVVTSSSHNMAEAEEAIIEVVDSDAGRITLKENLKYRHTGGSETVDGHDINLSAAVGLLTRTVSIRGEYVQGEAYGGRILVSVTLDGEDVRTGYARLSHVLFEHMGQDGFTEFADPRFALAFVETGKVTDVKPSEVIGCAFVDSFNTAVGVIGVADMQLLDNVVLRPLGNAIVTASENTVIDGNLVSSVLFTGVFEDRFEVENFRFEAGIEAIRATGLTLKNNYVAGSQRLGYHIAGEDCSLETSGYLNNVAVGCLYGVAVMPHDDLSAAGITSCSRLSGFTTFKNYDYGIYYNNEMSLVATGNYLVDEQVYLFPMVVFPDPLSHECGGKTVEVSDSVLIGTSSVTNCDAEEDPSGDYIDQNARNIRSLRKPDADRRGILYASFTGGNNNCGEKPCWGIMSYNAICGKMTIRGVTFKSFSGAKSGCKTAYALSTMYGNDDLAHPIHLSEVSLIDVNEEYIYWADRPNVGLVNPADCVDMDCDAKKKCIIRDLDGSLMGTPGTFVPDSAYEWNGDPRRGLSDNRIPNDMYANPDGSKMTIEELAPKGKGIVRTSACVKKSVGQGASAYYWCPHAEHEMLLIESLDDDTETRRLSPVAVLQDGYIDLINGPQDHGWCFGYTCQKRISTFHALVLPGISTDNIVQIYFSSTQPDKMRFALLDAIDECIVIGVYYLNPNRMDVYVNEEYVLPNNGEYNANNDFVLKNEDGVDYTPTCDEQNGANYIDRDAHIVYIAVKGGTEIDNAIQLKRADVILVSFGFPALREEDFFNDDTIIKNLANLLGITLDKIRVVKVIPASSRRRRRSTDTGITAELEIGDSPTPNFGDDSSSFTDIASDLMNQCQDGTISSSLGVSDTSCDQLVYGQTTYEPVPPEELWFQESITPEHEGVPFSVQPKIRAYDKNGEIVEHLGIEENPWEITASLRSCDPACGHSNAVLTGTLTVSASNGWFNFTDLQISHKGDNYIIDFEVTSPSGTNLTLATEPFSVKALPMTAGVYSMTSGDVPQDSTFTITLDLRDESTDIPIPDITWRDHTSFDTTCDIVAFSKTGNLTGVLSQTFDSSTGRATFNDLSFSGFGLIQIACLTVSTPAEYEFSSIHKVFVVGTHQVNIPKEVSKRVEVKYPLDFDKVLPTKVAEAQLEQVTVEAFATKWQNTLIRQSSITKGSIIVSFTVEGDSSNVSMATEEICEELSSGMTVTVGSSTLTLDGYMLVDGSDYYSSCGKSDKSEGLHPAFIALIVIACLLVIGIIIFLLVWKFKIRPKSKTHGLKGDDPNTTNRYPGGFYYIDNGRTVFLAAPNKKMKEGMSGNVETQAAGLAPLTTLYDETYGVFSIRKSPLPPGQEAVPRGLTPTGM